MALDSLLEFLRGARQQQEPVALLGASYGFVHLMDALAGLDEEFACRRAAGCWIPAASGPLARDPDGGSSTPSSRVFGVAREHCLNMYGMTELSTQCYDRGNAILPSVKRGLHWMRTRAIDPLTGQSVPGASPASWCTPTWPTTTRS